MTQGAREINRMVVRRRRQCKCDVCKAHAYTRGVIRRGDKREMRQHIRDLSEALCNTGEELGMANAYIKELTELKEPRVSE